MHCIFAFIYTGEGVKKFLLCYSQFLQKILCILLNIVEYQNKKHAFNWLNTLHVTFTIPRYRLGCRYRPVQKPCIDWCYRSIHGFGPVYITINRNFKTPSMILIENTLKMSICLYVRFYLFLTLQFLLRFLDSLKNIYFVCLQFNKHNSY